MQRRVQNRRTLCPRRSPPPPEDDSTSHHPGQPPGPADPTSRAGESTAEETAAEQEAAPPSPAEPEKKKRRLTISLIDVAVLLSITLVLGAILGPNWIRARARGQLTACKSNLKNIGTALEMYSTDWSGKYPTSTSLLTPNYLKTIPECPGAGENSYRASFGPSAPYNPEGYEDYYFVECTGENHNAVSVSGNFPAYNGIQGLIERRP